MNLYFRVLTLLLKRFISRRKMSLLETSILHIRVWPFDLDNNGHMNNGRYSALMDLGRLDIVLRTPLFSFCRSRGCFPVVGALKVNFLRPLKPFQGFELKSRIAGWDSKWIYFDQVFESAGEICAKGIIQGLLVSRGKKIPTSQWAEAMQLPQSPPNLPDDIEEWLRPT